MYRKFNYKYSFSLVIYIIHGSLMLWIWFSDQRRSTISSSWQRGQCQIPRCLLRGKSEKGR